MATVKCVGCQGDTESNLRCPMCLAANVESVFCTKECFQENYRAHDEQHAALAEQAASLVGYAPESMEKFDVTKRSTWVHDARCCDFMNPKQYSFTGSLRPYPMTPQRDLSQHEEFSKIPRPDYADHAEGRSKSEELERGKPIRVYRTVRDLNAVKRTCQVAREALDLGHSMIKLGVTGDEVDAAVHNYIVSQGGYPSPLNYYKFPKSCCISINETVCHGIPDMRPFQEGDLVNLDVSCYVDGMHGDLNETYVVKGVKADGTEKTIEEMKTDWAAVVAKGGDEGAEAAAKLARLERGIKLIKASYESMMKAIKGCGNNKKYSDIGDVIEKSVKADGFSIVKNYTGHGCGSLFHCNPSVLHYANNRSKGLIKEGHVFTIEPMVNSGTGDNTHWPDNWTCVTKDGRDSAQFEHQLLVTKTGVQILTHRLPTSPPLDFESEYFAMEC